mmetsp:Transcript_19830/g.50374  ORF Transcript_19830/g.50374 Transcript_19830/m.50374 type:complete len:119 (-) Transcript_19830:2387-2743(-)|eukprot:CAMPEP_0174232122 /NCGR_PEP_ID=MMETSP0417-20130205/2499_1 /TAXON_ID=242541 /ORGANISM="Mayorella sp, Strain BSH-02190019" /LENGTH=118 /DNA_ID=CAMNT_0015310117 /DNA_START=159 /DNA_END=515 /DNA_ORIENTATION=-
MASQSVKYRATSSQLERVKIALGSCDRLYRDVQQYRVEEAQQIAEVDRLSGSGAEAYDVKQARAVLQETRTMIPITLEELRTARRRLQECIDESESELEQADASLLASARASLSRAEP